MKKAVIVAFDNFTDLDVFLAWDLLNRVRYHDKAFEVKIIGTQKWHQSQFGLPLKIHGALEESKNADLVFFASGPGSRSVIQDQDFLRRFHLNSNNQILCSVCSGALILAALGHLTGLPATTYPTVAEALKDYGVDVREQEHLVTHRNIGTASNCLAAVDLIGWAIEKLYSKKIKEAVLLSALPLGSTIVIERSITKQNMRISAAV